MSCDSTVSEEIELLPLMAIFPVGKSFIKDLDSLSTRPESDSTNAIDSMECGNVPSVTASTIPASSDSKASVSSSP